MPATIPSEPPRRAVASVREFAAAAVAAAPPLTDEQVERLGAMLTLDPDRGCADGR